MTSGYCHSSVHNILAHMQYQTLQHGAHQLLDHPVNQTELMAESKL